MNNSIEVNNKNSSFEEEILEECLDLDKEES